LKHLIEQLLLQTQEITLRILQDLVGTLLSKITRSLIRQNSLCKITRSGNASA